MKLDIKRLSTQLLSPQLSQSEVERIIKEIHGYFQKITTITGYDTVIKHLAAVPTAKGMALSLNHAAQCLLDYKRTVKFLQGIVAAIREKKKNHPGQVIRILYAGCGPYAPFATLVAPLFQPNEVQFSLLEINQDSLESAKKLILDLEQTAYIQAYHLADAVTFEIPSPDSFDILISETLDALLYRESYVPILFNMMPQLPQDIVLIPENVLLKLTWLNDQEKDASEMKIEEHDDVQKILDVRQALASHAGSMTSLPPQLPSQQFKLTKTESDKHMIIDTEVHIYDDLILKRSESSLTIPYEITLENPEKAEKIVFTYHMEPQVELKCELQ